MRRPTLVLALAVVLAGCAAPAPETDSLVEDAGTPAAPGEPRRFTAPVEEGAPAGDVVTLHAYGLSEARPRPPAELVLEGTFDPTDCAVPVGSWAGGRNMEAHDIAGLFSAGDVAEIHARLDWTNTDQSWADLHLILRLPGRWDMVRESQAQERGDLSQELEAQMHWRGTSSDRASVGVMCWYSSTTEPMAYRITVHVTYVANAVPAETPVLVRFPDEARRLLVTGAPTSDLPVTSHFRVFDAEDVLLGEYALNSDEEFAAVELPSGGDYVVIVDHTENGFVTLGADAPPDDPRLVALARAFAGVTLWQQDEPGPASASVAFTLPRVPLGLFLWADAAADAPAGAAKGVELHVEGPRGMVLHFVQEGFVSTTVPQRMWLPIPGLGWDLTYDHHALARGDHLASIEAEVFQGRLTFYWITYLRPGEEGQGPPDILGTDEGGASTPSHKGTKTTAYPERTTGFLV